MKQKALYFIAFAVVSLLSISCGGGANSNTATANNTVSSNTAADTTSNSAPTLTPVFKAYCEAMVKKDEAALRKIYSSETIKYFEAEMKEEKIKTLMEYLDDKVSGNICEVRNEVITGDKAVAEIRADSYPNGIKIEFVKENGEWKMTNKSPVLDAVKANSNSAPANAAPANVANRPEADPSKKKESK